MQLFCTAFAYHHHYRPKIGDKPGSSNRHNYLDIYEMDDDGAGIINVSKKKVDL